MGFIKQGWQTGNGTTRLEKWVGLKLYPFVFVNEDIRMFPLEADKFILSFIFGFDFIEEGDDGWVDTIPSLFHLYLVTFNFLSYTHVYIIILTNK